MTHRFALLASLLVLTAAAATPCAAQSPTPPASSSTAPSAPSTAAPASSTTAPSAAAKSDTSTAAPSDSSEPSPDTLRMARKEGFKAKKRDGKTLFCYTDASLGTKLPSEKCYNQAEMEQQVQLRREQREQLGHAGACAGAACSGH